MTIDRFAIMRRVYAAAVERAPALHRRFADAGLRPEDLTDAEALSRLPVLKKEQLIALQQRDPPFAGFLGCGMEEIGHIYISPGPIFEPSLVEDRSGHGMDRMFSAAGIGSGDVALNTWSYHLVPAGLLFDRGLRAVGATVVPAGTGVSDLQAELVMKLGVTAFVGSTAFFITVAEKIEAAGHSIPRDWRLKHAFLGGEFGDWAAKRRALEQRYGVKTWSCYATADFGLIGYEEEGQSGYTIHPDRYVQICDSETGWPLPPGETGEIVVTTLTRGWPMIRFGTGDVSQMLEVGGDGGAVRLAPLQGRIGGAVKAREIFIYPGQVATLAGRVPGIERLALTVERPGARDEITARVLPAAAASRAAIEVQLRQVFPTVTRLKLDHVLFVDSGEQFGEAAPVADAR